METEEVPNNHGIIAAEDFNKNPFSFFECSPVGAYCVHPTCLEKNNSYIGNYTNPTARDFKYHFTTHHGMSTKEIKIERARTFGAEVKNLITSSRSKSMAYFASEPRIFQTYLLCTKCKHVYASKRDFEKKHLGGGGGAKCSGECVKTKVVYLRGGRFCPVHYFRDQNNNDLNTIFDNQFETKLLLPVQLVDTRPSVQAILFPFIHPTDKVEQWSDVLYPFVVGHQENLSSYVKQQWTVMSSNIFDEPELVPVIQMADYFFDRCDVILNILPANLSEELIKFKKTVPARFPNTSWTFTPRRSYDKIKKDFIKLILFLNHNNHVGLSKLKQYGQGSDFDLEKAYRMALIPKFLFDLTTEPCDWARVERMSPVVNFLFLTCFQLIEQKTKIRLKETGYAGTKMSNLLHMLRVGSTGWIVATCFGIMNNTPIDNKTLMDVSDQLCKQVQESFSINKVARSLHQLREQSARKPNQRNVLVDGSLNIIVDHDYNFRFVYWSQLVIRISRILDDIFGFFFTDDKFRAFLEVRHPVTDHNLLDGSAKVILSDGTCLSLQRYVFRGSVLFCFIDCLAFLKNPPFFLCSEVCLYVSDPKF